MITKSSNRTYALKFLKFLGFITLLIMVTHLILQYLNLEVYYQQNGFAYELSNRFDLDDEASVSTWFSQFLFLLIGAGAGFAAYLSKNTSIRRAWALIALAGLLFSIDEVASLHEFALQSLHNIFYRDVAPTSINNAWLLVAPVIFFVAVWLIYKMAKILPKRTTFLFAVAVATFLVGAVFVDALASITDRETFLNQGIMIAIEESLELFGAVIVVYAITDYIEKQHGTKIKNSLKQLK